MSHRDAVVPARFKLATANAPPPHLVATSCAGRNCSTAKCSDTAATLLFHRHRKLHNIKMAEDKQPPAVVEGATGGDVEEEVQPTAKSAEDRKAAAALSSLDSNREDESSAQVDQDAVKNAFHSLSTAGSKQAEVKKVKVDAADVALLVSGPNTADDGDSLLTEYEQVEELELTKAKATELLKAHDGDAVKAINAYVAAPAA